MIRPLPRDAAVCNTDPVDLWFVLPDGSGLGGLPVAAVPLYATNEPLRPEGFEPTHVALILQTGAIVCAFKVEDVPKLRAALDTVAAYRLSPGTAGGAEG